MFISDNSQIRLLLSHFDTRGYTPLIKIIENSPISMFGNKLTVGTVFLQIKNLPIKFCLCPKQAFEEEVLKQLIFIPFLVYSLFCFLL